MEIPVNMTQRNLHYMAASGILFIAALFATLYQPAQSSWLTGGGETVAIAHSLITNGTFADPWIAVGPTGPSAHLPPLFPMFLAFLIKHLGATYYVLPTVFVHALHAALLPFVSVLLFGSMRPGVYGAILSILLPVYELLPVWDAMYTATGLMAFLLLSAKILEWRWPEFIKGIFTGIAGAFLLLLNPISATVFGPWLIYLLHSRRIPIRRASLNLAGFGLAVILGCLPWTVRNYRVFDAFVPIRDSMGLVLYSSNNACAESSLQLNMANGCHQLTHPIASAAENRLVREMGEVRYNRYRLATAFAWIRTHPWRFLNLTVQRAADFWFPSDSRSASTVTLLSLLGCWLVWRKIRPLAGFAFAVFALYPAVYYIAEAVLRYRYPILWLSLLLAGLTLAEIERWVRFRTSSRILGVRASQV